MSGRGNVGNEYTRGLRTALKEEREARHRVRSEKKKKRLKGRNNAAAR